MTFYPLFLYVEIHLDARFFHLYTQVVRQNFSGKIEKSRLSSSKLMLN